jgi:preprotein translocase subunit SecE
MTRNKNETTPTEGKKESTPPKKRRAGPFQYLSQVRQEARKVTWTSGQETLVSTVLVLILSTIAMLFFWGVDTLLQIIIRQLLSLGS